MRRKTPSDLPGQRQRQRAGKPAMARDRSATLINTREKVDGNGAVRLASDPSQGVVGRRSSSQRRGCEGHFAARPLRREAPQAPL